MYPKREKIFLVLAGIFLTSLIMANIIGITKIFNFMGIGVPVGIIPYPITFLVTDLISEHYGKERAAFIVLTGFILNMFMLVVATLGYYAPANPDWLNAVLSGADPESAKTYERVYTIMMRGTFASMVAYLLAQYLDVRVFHWIKAKTNGRYLWLRNNGSTMASQLVDTVSVMFITFYGILPLDQILQFIMHGYLFKVCVAFTDTPFFYLGAKWLKKHAKDEAVA